jgi:23S rRNA pseudouridine1911/1915/1917 synthase
VSVNDGHVYVEVIGPDGHGRTVADWLARRAHTDLATWRARAEAGAVRINDVVVGPETTLARGDRLAWHRPPWAEPDVPLEFAVLHADDDVLVVSKPAGLPTVPSGGFLANTLLTRVNARFPGSVPMHRLGTGTSGIVVFARSERARSALQAAWRRREVEKVYLAVVLGTPQDQAIDVPIGPVPHPSLGTVHAASPSGRPSRSHVRAIGAFDGHTVVEVRIETGRPHQIRIHLAAIGHPLVGDPLFLPGGGVDPAAFPTALGYRLHAVRVGLVHPGTSLRTAWDDPPPWPVSSR